MEKAKVTVKENFETLKKVIAGEITLDADAAMDMITFLDGRIEQISKKRSGETKVQKANKELAQVVLEKMKELGRKISATELFNELRDVEGIASAQKVTSLLKTLQKSEDVIRTEEKGKALFEVAE